MNKPLVSIACITYNHEKFISQAIEGFLIQKTTFPIEIIIHDDASIDNTAKIITEYAENYPDLITLIFQEENKYSKGLKPMINFVIPRCRGKYIAICEGDDFWTDPLKLEQQVAFLESHIDYVVCYHDSIVVDIDNNLIKTAKLSDDQRRDYSRHELMTAVKVLPNTMCFKNVIREFPDEYNRAFGGDKFLTALLGAYGKGKYLETIHPSAFRLHPGGINSGKKNTYLKLSKHLSTRIALYQYYDRIGETEYAYHFLVNGIYDVILKMIDHYDTKEAMEIDPLLCKK